MPKGFMINVYKGGSLFNNGQYSLLPIKGYQGIPTEHDDPSAEQPYCYGDHPENKGGLKKIEVGDYLIFHVTLTHYATQETARYITGGFKIRLIIKVGHLTMGDKECYLHNWHVKHNDMTATLYTAEKLIPHTKEMFMRRPLLFSVALADELKLKIKEREGYSEHRRIAYATRAVRKLEQQELNILFKRIKQREEKWTSDHYKTKFSLD